MLEFLTLKPEAFGLDISDLSLKIVKLKKKGKFFSLASFGEFPIKKGIIEKGEIKDQKALSEIIQNAILKVRGERLKTKYVVASLPEEKAFLQVIQMPILEPEELKSAVKYEAENYIPLPIEQVYLDFQIVKPVYNHLDHLDVLIAALPKKTIDPYVQVLKKAGLKPLALEIESQATARALVKNQVSPFPLLIVDLGATRTSFIIFSGYSLRFTSSIPICGNTFTKAIAKNLGISFKKAEKIKIKYGLKKTKIKIKNKKEKEMREGIIFQILTPALTDLVEQIKKYLDYYHTHASHEHLPPDGKGVEKIFLCGGGASMKGICQFLSREFKLPVELGNPWINILPEPKREIPEIPFEESLRYTTALGLALRAIKND